MLIGIPKEQKTLEKRIALTPDGARELVAQGHQVMVETGAGVGSFFEDLEYQKAGCQIILSAEELWKRADLIVKVKEPQESEFGYLRPNLLLFTYLHLASEPAVTDALLETGTRSIAYELVYDRHGGLPLLQPMSEIAGKLAVINGSFYLLSHQGGRGLLLGGSTGVARGKVVIIGGGAAGAAACEVALGMGAYVTVLERDRYRMEQLKSRFGNHLNLGYSTSASIQRFCSEADLLVGAVLIPGATAPKVVTREMVAGMKPGSVIVDISIDQGGCVETIKTTSLKEPTFVDMDVVHYGVGNMPAQTPRTSTMALTSATLPYVSRIASGISNWTPDLVAAISTYDGKLTNQAVAKSLKLPFVPVDQAVAQGPVAV